MADIEDNKTIKLYTFGCSHNLSDSEVMRHDLESAGYIVDTSNTPISSSSNYHAVIVNSCTVKNPSEQAIDTIKKKCDATSTPIVIAGCVPQADPKTCRCGKNCSVIGVDQLHHINDAIDKAVAGDGASFISRGPLVQISGHSRENPLIEILVTCTGCENACTYCKTMQARGRLRSYGVDALVNRVKDAVKEGVTEIRLTGEDIGAYGKDIGLTFPFMLRKLIEAAQGKALLRIGMVNPPYIKEYFDEIIDILKLDNVAHFLHIPIQSGSDDVLVKMKRGYTVKDFNEICQRLKQEIPDMTIATDIICGFPEETDEDHNKTVELINTHKFPIVNISQMYVRPNTPACLMKAVNSKIVKQRSRDVTNTFNSYNPYDHLLNTTCMVWINEIARDGVHYAAHNVSYVQVLLPMDENKSLLGKKANVQITECGKFYVRATILEIL